MSGDGPAEPLPSATVAVVRDGRDAPEILLVRRRAGFAFGNAYTFPGGVVDHDESNAHIVCDGRTANEANAILGVGDGLDYYSAAIRELFEETGILLARDADGNWPADAASYAEQRIAVDRSELAWPDFLRNEGLCMAGDALHYFAWWTTPVDYEKRWSARFFAAALPPGQQARHDGKELTDSRWLTAKDALALRDAGELKLPQPTRRNLALMAEFRSADELLGWAAARHREGVPSITPVRVMVDGDELWPIPGDPHYPAEAPA